MIHTKETQIERLKEYTRLNLRLPNTHGEKTKLIKLGIFKSECSICLLNSWQGKEISLHLDHIDGNPRNNLLENLRLLCPNCHSQTNTYCGRNNKGLSRKLRLEKDKPRCLDCRKPVSTTWTQRCVGCRNSLNELKETWPTPNDFIEMIKNRTSMEDLAKQLGVSSNAIRKRCRKLGIEY